MRTVGHDLHAGEVDIHVADILFMIEETANSNHETTEKLNFFLLEVVDIREQLLDALVHDALCEHVSLEQLSNEPHQNKTLSFSLLSGIVLFRKDLFLLGG